MGTRQSELARYIRKEIEQAPATTVFHLRICDAEGRTELIEKFGVPEKIDDIRELCDQMAIAIWEAGESYTSSWQGVCRFKVYAHVTPKNFRSHHMFRIASENKGSVGETEPATSTGILAMMMRHQEATMRMAMGAIADSNESLRDEVKSLRARAAQAEQSQFDWRIQVEELLDRKHERTMASDKLAASEARKNMAIMSVQREVIPQLAQYIPSLLESIGIGKKKLPDSPSVDAEKLADFKKKFRDMLAVLPDDAMNELADKIPPEHRQAFGDFVTTLSD